MSAAPQYMRAHAVAKLLGLTERTVRRWIADGTLHSVKVGGARLVTDKELERLLGQPGPFAEDDEDDEE